MRILSQLTLVAECELGLNRTTSSDDEVDYERELTAVLFRELDDVESIHLQKGRWQLRFFSNEDQIVKIASVDPLTILVFAMTGCLSRFNRNEHVARTRDLQCRIERVLRRQPWIGTIIWKKKHRFIEMELITPVDSENGR